MKQFTFKSTIKPTHIFASTTVPMCKPVMSKSLNEDTKK